MAALNLPNPTILLQPNGEDLEWVNQNTAILVAHGIGNQLPLETLDQFGRGLIKQYRQAFDDELSITHEIVAKPDDRGGSWFDNVLRIHKAGSDKYIDLYEYYWANYSQDKATWKDLNSWLQGVVTGATKFYRRNELIGEQYKDKSPFFDSKTGMFKPFRYWLFLSVIGKLFLFIDLLWRLILWLISMIPLAGKLADILVQAYADSLLHDLCNVISEVAIYNVFDPKSKFYDTRRQIADGAVKAITYLIERPTDDAAANKQQLYYPSVIIAGHSLGSQVTYDAINKINLLINMGKISTYDTDGNCTLKHKTNIAAQIKGFVTFGCPLDKIVFFLRENVPDNEYLRQQFLDNYHEFKQRDIDISTESGRYGKNLVASCGLKRMLENVPWRNYFDGKDYVSGGLDYYKGLTNIDCHFKAGRFGFTHSYYWEYDNFYKDIINNFLQ